MVTNLTTRESIDITGESEMYLEIWLLDVTSISLYVEYALLHG